MPPSNNRTKNMNAISLAQKIPKIKGEIMNRICDNDKISKLVYYNDENALRMPSLPNARRELINERVFPYRFVPESIDTQGTYITVGTYFAPMQDGFSYAENFNSLTFYLYVFTHTQLMKTKSGTRQDLLLSELDLIFDKTELVGMGRIRMRGVQELWLHNNKFGGYILSYTIGDM